MIKLWNKKIPAGALGDYTSAVSAGDAIGASTIERFEDALCEEFSRKHAVACSSGTGALMAALSFYRDKGLQKICLPSISWIANLNVAVSLGYDVGFRGVDTSSIVSQRQQIRPEMSEALVWKLIHLSGRLDRPPDKGDGCYVVEDLSQAQYSRAESGSRAGGLGHVSVSSTSITKALTTVHGGFLITDDSEAAQWARRYVRNGVDNNLTERWGHIGLNFKPNAANASIGLFELKRREEIKERLSAVMHEYRQGLSSVDGLRLLTHERGETPLYVEVVCEDAKKLIEFLASRGVQTKSAPPPLWSAVYLSDSGREPLSPEVITSGSWPSQHVVILPGGPDIGVDEIAYVCDCLKDFSKVYD